MDNEPDKNIEEQEQKELDEQQAEEVAGGKVLSGRDLKNMAAAGAEKLSEAELKKIAAGKVDARRLKKDIQ
jgi:hypothetical protein